MFLQMSLPNRMQRESRNTTIQRWRTFRDYVVARARGKEIERMQELDVNPIPN